MENHDFLLTYRDYEVVNNGGVVFRLFGRDALGNRVVHHVSGIRPYLYVPMGTPIQPDTRIQSVDAVGIPSFKKETLKRIYVSKPSDVGGRNENETYIRDMYEKTFEGDVLFENRGAIDHDLNGILTCPDKIFLNVSEIHQSESTEPIPVRQFIFDIENEDNGTIEEAKDGKKEIYIVTIYDSKTKIYHIFSSYSHTQIEEAEIKSIIEGHWKNNPYFPEYSLPILQFHYFPDEVSMLEGIIVFFEHNPPDILAGYNSNGYDIPAFCHRCKKLGIEFSRLSEVHKVYPNRPLIAGMACMDIQDLYQKYQPGTVTYPSLNYVSGVELETSKLPRISIIELYQKDRVRLTAYNIIDVQLTVAINEKHFLVDFFNELSISAHSSFEVQSSSTLIDNLLLREVSGEMALPTRPKKSIITTGGQQIRGGIVYQSTPGLHENVVVLDFAGMYPSIIIALNISPDTKDPNGDIVAANGIRFNSKPIGIIPRALKKLKIKRKGYKKLKAEAEAKGIEEEKELGKITQFTTSLIKQYDLKQYAVKVLMNAFYGVMNFEGFRLKDAEMGDAITSTGQKLSTSCRSYVETVTIMFENKAVKIEVIYGDTDSLFIKVIGDYTPTEIYKIAGIMAKGVNEEIDRLMQEIFNVTKHEVSIEIDKVFRTLFQVNSKLGKGAKKRYAGIIYNFDADGNHTGEKEVLKGFEAIKSDSTKLTKDVQRHLLFELILKGAKKEKVREYLLGIKEKFDNDEISTQDLSIRAPLKKPIKEYHVDRPQINGIKNAIMYLKRDISVGYVGSYYKLSQSPYNLPTHDVIVLDFDEPLPDGYVIDSKFMWERAVYKPTYTILEAYELSWDYINTGKMTRKLSTIFNMTGEKRTPEKKTETDDMDDFYESLEYNELLPPIEPPEVKVAPKQIKEKIIVDDVDFLLKRAFVSQADATEYELTLRDSKIEFKILKVADLIAFYECPPIVGILSKYIKIK